MNNQKKTVNLPGLMKGILRHWPVLLLCGILCAVLGRAYAQRAAKKARKEIQEITEAQQSAVASTASPALLAQIDRMLDVRESYLENSAAMNLDMTNVAFARATVSISTEDLDAELFPQKEETETSGTESPAGQETEGGETGGETDVVETPVLVPETAPSDDAADEAGESSGYQNTSAAAQHAVTIMNAYRNRLIHGLDWGALPDELGIEPRYLRELCSYSEPDSSFYITSMFTAASSDLETSEKLLDHMLAEFEKMKPEIERLYGKHTVTVSRYNPYFGMDNGRAGTFSTRVSEYNTLLNQKAGILKNSTPAAAAEEEVTLPSVPSVSLFTALGFVIGLFLSAYLRGLLLIMKDTVLAGDELDGMGVPRIAGLPDRHLHSPGIAGLLARIGAGSYSSSNADVACKIAAETIRNIKDGGTIGIAGDLKAPLLEAFAEKLNAAAGGTEKSTNYVALPDLASGPASLEKIRDCDAMIIVGETCVSCLPRLKELANIAGAYGKDLIGTISIG